jgi:hypothetical protein
MKKLIIIASLFSMSAWAQSEKTLESHIADAVKPLAKLIEGKKGKVVLSTFKSTSTSLEACAPNKGINTKINAILARSGVPTVIASRSVSMDSEQAEISRVAKLSGGSFIILGTYELIGSKFKIDCALYDHNGSSIGACEEAPAVLVSPETVQSINCPKIEKTPEATPAPKAEAKTEAADESQIKKIDDYICSVIHRDYDLKRLINNLYEKKLYTLPELKGIGKSSNEDALEQRQDTCVTLGNFVICTNHWSGNGAQVFLSGGTPLGATKVVSWKHPNKALVKENERCLKKDNDWWNP